MLRPKEKIVKYIKKNYIEGGKKGLRMFSVGDMEDLLFECHDDDMEFYIEELVGSAGTGEAFLYVSYFDENANCVCLVEEVEPWYEDNAEGVADRMLRREALVEKYKLKFLIFKE